MSIIRNNYQSILDDIKTEMRHVPGLNVIPDIIAVSKTKPAEDIKEAIAAGANHFGENRVQEAQEKWPDLKAKYPDLTLHMIGAIQSKKAADVVTLFDVIHSVDRPKLVDALAKEMKKQNRNLPCFIQVNTGDEDQKAGIAIDDLADLLDHCTTQNLHIIGLMCIPPVDEIAAPHFALLKKLTDQYGLEKTSMGMSDDYRQAVTLGSSYVRIGSGIFGERLG